jgi:hypothetical protein
MVDNSAWRRQEVFWAGVKQFIPQAIGQSNEFAQCGLRGKMER